MRRMNLKAVPVALFLVGVGLLAWAVLAGRPSARAQGPNPQPVTISFSSTSYTVGEADGTVTLTVTLNQAASGTVTVDYSTTDGTAVSNPDDEADYVAASGTLTFAPGETSKAIVIAILDDPCCESNETFTVTLSNATGGASIIEDTATITIVDNDTTCP
jgi:Calx-beta domain-containing protein